MSPPETFWSRSWSRRRLYIYEGPLRSLQDRGKFIIYQLILLGVMALVGILYTLTLQKWFADSDLAGGKSPPGQHSVSKGSREDVPNSSTEQQELPKVAMSDLQIKVSSIHEALSPKFFSVRSRNI